MDMHLQQKHQQIQDFIAQARWRLDLLSEDLLPSLLQSEEILEQFRQLATRGRHSRIRLLSRDTDLTARNGHLLIPLIQRLPSVIEARVNEPDRCTQPWWLILIDGQQALLQQDEDSQPIQLAANSSQRWQERFDECWQHAHPDHNLRRLSL